jgi:hypothetical protein
MHVIRRRRRPGRWLPSRVSTVAKGRASVTLAPPVPMKGRSRHELSAVNCRSAAAGDPGRRYGASGERHRGQDRALLAQRKGLYEQAKARNPQRWTGAMRDWTAPSEVWLNPENSVVPKAPKEEMVAV